MSERNTGEIPNNRFREAFERSVARVATERLRPKGEEQTSPKKWHTRFEVHVNDDDDLDVIVRFQRYAYNVRLEAAEGTIPAPATAIALDKRSLSLIDGTDTSESTVGPYSEVLDQSDTRGVDNQMGSLASLYTTVMDQPLRDDQFIEVVGSYYSHKDELFEHTPNRAPLLAASVLNRIVTTIDQRDDDSRRVLLRGIAHQLEQSEFRDRHLDAFNNQVVRSLAEKKKLDDSEYQPHTPLATFLDDMHDYGLLRPLSLTRPHVMVQPAVAELLLAVRGNDVDIFADIKTPTRLTYAQKYIDNILDYLESDETRNAKNIVALKKNLFTEKRRDTISWTDVIKLSNGITQTINRHKPPENIQQLLPEAGDPQDLIYLGEALFRLLNITSHTEQQTHENRNYADLLDAMLQPIYAQLGKTPTYTSAEDVRKRYPGTSEQQVNELMSAADRGGYGAASQLYAEARRTHGTTVFHDRNKPGHGIIS